MRTAIPMPATEPRPSNSHPGTGLWLRPMSPNDLAAVLALERATQISPWSQGIFQDSLKAGHCCLVLESAAQDALLGYAIAMFAADECHLLNLAIAPDHQGRGLGRLLLRRVLAIARRRAAVSVFLEVRASNQAALALYRAEGFNEIGLRRNYYPAATGREDAVMMACTLIDSQPALADCATQGSTPPIPGHSQGLWLPQARPCPSPNRDHRPPHTEVDLLVIHAISLPPGDFGGPWIEQLFLNQLDPAAHPAFRAIAHLRVSAHLLIRRDGELVQFVDLRERAWHAGISSFQGRENCNDFSIGIELEGTDECQFSDAQYQRLATVTRAILDLYPAIGPGRILGHEHIAPGRKTDPGAGFDWPRYLQNIPQPVLTSSPGRPLSV